MEVTNSCKLKMQVGEGPKESTGTAFVLKGNAGTVTSADSKIDEKFNMLLQIFSLYFDLPSHSFLNMYNTFEYSVHTVVD